MKQKKILFVVLGGVFLLYIGACASTEIVSAWKDPEYKTGQIKKIMVIGVFRQPTTRRFFEDEFASRIKAKGIQAVPGYSLIQDEKMAKDTVLAKVRELGIDTILISRVVDKKTLETYYPPQTRYVGPRPYYRNWYGYYYDSNQYMTMPGYTTQQQVVRVETSMYDTSNENLIWSALSETYVESPDTKDITAFISALMKQLESQGMLR